MLPSRADRMRMAVWVVIAGTTLVAVGVIFAQVHLKPRERLRGLVGELPPSVASVRHRCEATGLFGYFAPHRDFFRFETSADDMDVLAARVGARVTMPFRKPSGAPDWWQYTSGARYFAFGPVHGSDYVRGIWSPDGSVLLWVDVSGL
ncbi:MAG: hypothetical protein H6698_01820 [Myxococcales bacterium]|nr:hypothetical protein [Myxococcales bacterium]